ncbi:MAG: DUF1003 domain-containing protein [Candidatus Dormibacteria bacterium]|jgi:uncharacterized membrane protein
MTTPPTAGDHVREDHLREDHLREDHLREDHYRRFLKPYEHLARPFGADGFGRRAESFARFFGTPRFLVGQTVIVAAWIAVNVVAIFRWDPYPFILLNLMFSLQAAYAAPLILLAQTRQADRDKAQADADAQHRETVAAATLGRQQMAQQGIELLRQLIDENTHLTQQIEELTEKIHGKLVAAPG